MNVKQTALPQPADGPLRLALAVEADGTQPFRGPPIMEIPLSEEAVIAWRCSFAS